MSALRRIGELVYAKRSVSGDEHVDSVAKLFEREPRLEAVATLEQDGSFGLVLRSHLTRELGRQFGYALFARKPIHIFNENAFLTCDIADEPVKVIAEATKRGEAAIYDDIVVTEAGAYYGLVSMRLLMAHSKELLVQSMAEVDELELQNQKLDELNRAQRDFVANVTHELRAPLNTMLGVANLLSLDPELPAIRRRDVQMLLNRGRDLLSLVNNLLELHRLQLGDVRALPVATPLAQLLDDCVDAARYLIAERPVELVCHYQRLPEQVLVDGILLRRLLTNLLSNAVKFTDRGRVTLLAQHHHGLLVLHIKDTGIGIASEDLPKLFRKFVQLEAAKTKRHAGTGLGLAIVRDLAELLHGTITVESKLGVGSTFVVTIPAEPSVQRERSSESP